MKLLTYLLLISSTAATQTTVRTVDSAADSSQLPANPGTNAYAITPQPPTSLADWSPAGDVSVDERDKEKERNIEIATKSLEVAIAITGALANIHPGFAVACAVLQIAMIFMPKVPSAEEVAIKKGFDNLNKKLDKLHGETMGELSRLGRNQFFLHAIDKIQTLEALVRVQSAFRNMYNKRAGEFACGVGATQCILAYRGWTGALPRSTEQLLKDGHANEYNGLTSLGYNSGNSKAVVDISLRQLKSFSVALSL